MTKIKVRNIVLGLLICSVGGIGLLWISITHGNEIASVFGFTGDSPPLLEPAPKLTVMLNGSDVSQTYSAHYEEGQIYVSALPLLEKLGVAVLAPDPSTSYACRTLLAVTQDHELQHSVGTTEISLNGETLTLEYPSILEDDNVYVPPSFFEIISVALLSQNFDEINMDLVAPVESSGLQALNAQKNTSYFRADHLFRYADYIKKNPNLDVAEAIIYVNANLDQPFYSNVNVIANTDDILILCNKYNQFPDGYVPKDLRNVGGGFLLRTEAAEAYQKMMQAAAEQGIFFRLRSAYRSYEEQQMLYTNAVTRQGTSQADLYSARPGYSEHHSGLAIDITIPTNASGSLAAVEFEKTPQFAWFHQHAHEYGFILRYPSDKVSITGYAFEPWHYRYVGKDTAKKIYDQGITLEEYIAMEING